MSQYTINLYLKYFFRGLLFLVPLTLTIYIIIVSIDWLDSLIPVKVPGLGLLIIIVTITFFGYLGSTLLVKPIFDALEKLIIKLPLANLIYTSLKDLMAAFVGDKKKFNQAVLVTMNGDFGVQKMGFITQEDLSLLGLPGKVAVYLPHSYNFSGNLFVVPRENVIFLDLPSSDVMKFIVSGGVAGLKTDISNKLR
ncbi:MAG: DUF502 domain-containing protein [Candidatus Cyclobacteriaceae bacterium M3_2C_046]